MRLTELVGLRPVPCAGLLVTITQRCPLRCAHCSSASTMAGAEPDPRRLVRFVGSFGSADRPEVVMLTGGEPMLLPDLVTDLAEAARAAGSRTALLTGAFFAAAAVVPAPIRRAIRSVDHFSVSLDAFHERQVPRAHVFRLLREVIDDGIPVSVHAAGSAPQDDGPGGYLAGLVADVRRTFADQVPLLVNRIRPVGRAAAWAAARPAYPDPDQVLPCAMAAWPVIAHDGTVVACCHQETVDRRPVPDHLRLGHIDVDDWATVRGRALSSPVLRLIRSTGPTYLTAHQGAAPASGACRPDQPGYCTTCRRLSERPAALDLAHRLAAGPAGHLLDRHATRVQVEAGPVAFVRRHGYGRYADLVTLSPRTEPNRVDAR